MVALGPWDITAISWHCPGGLTAPLPVAERHLMLHVRRLASLHRTTTRPSPTTSLAATVGRAVVVVVAMVVVVATAVATAAAWTPMLVSVDKRHLDGEGILPGGCAGS